MTTDAAGNVLLLAMYNRDYDRRSLFVAKLEAGTGATLWSRSFRIGDRVSFASGLDLDAAGDVLLSFSMEGRSLVTKLEGSTGSELWSRDMGWVGGEAPGPAYLKVVGAGSVFVLKEHSGEMFTGTIDLGGGPRCPVMPSPLGGEGRKDAGGPCPQFSKYSVFGVAFR